MRKVIKIELALLEQIYQNHRLAHERGRVPELFSRAKLYKKVAETLDGHLVIEATGVERSGGYKTR